MAKVGIWACWGRGGSAVLVGVLLIICVPTTVVADVLSEFLEVAVHLILYVREVYPVGIFQKRKKYNVPVQMSCHPELNQYIQDTLHCVKPLLEKVRGPLVLTDTPHPICSSLLVG